MQVGFAVPESSMGSDGVSGCRLCALPSHASSAPDDLLGIHVPVALEKAFTLVLRAGMPCAKELAFLSCTIWKLEA